MTDDTREGVQAVLPPYQITLEFTIKGTADYCRERADKLEAYAKRLGLDFPFIEEEPNSDLERLR
jgi:hypothetical protein